MKEISEVLKERTKDYGKYIDGVQLRVDIMGLIVKRYNKAHGSPMPPLYESMIFDIVNKLTRIAVTPLHKDSWVDIQGYSKLIAEEIENAIK